MSGIQALLQALASSGARFIVVGAYAAILHGSTSRTDDLDICYERNPENYKRLIRALSPFHPHLRGLPDDLKTAFDEHSLAQGTNFPLTTDHGHLDLLGELSGVGGYASISRSAVCMTLGAITCCVADLETVIRSKEAANRPKDQATLPELRALKMMIDLERGSQGN